MFKAILIAQTGSDTAVNLRSLETQLLPAGDVLVNILYSTINYKDALAITNTSPVARIYPLVPGIDFVGVVAESKDARFKKDDHVILNGWGVGEKHWGGLAQQARVQGDWLIHLPQNITPQEAMAVGTAGYTAMLCIMALEKQGLTPDQGDVLVTGANGGVGSFAISFLAQLGYRVVASTGRLEESDYLKHLGAAEIIDRHELSEPGKPLQRIRWAAAIDSVGSVTLANVCAGIKDNGAVAACGLAQGMDFPATVAPFILRGVSLLGINSVMQSTEQRIKAWSRIAKLIQPVQLAQMTHEISLEEVIPAATDLLQGRIRGRLVVDVNR